MRLKQILPSVHLCKVFQVALQEVSWNILKTLPQFFWINIVLNENVFLLNSFGESFFWIAKDYLAHENTSVKIILATTVYICYMLYSLPMKIV